MRPKTKMFLCLALALLMLLPLAACKKDTPAPETSAPVSSAPAPTTSNAPAQTPETPPPAAAPQTLVVGYSYFSQKFSSLFAKTSYDRDVADMTQDYLLINDRAGNVIMNGIEGETLPYNGVDYNYKGIADFDVVEKPDGTVDYNITLRNGVLFSDGVPMTIDDVIFTMYTLSDPTYDGGYTFYSTPITGMQNYRTGLSTEIYDKYNALGTAMLDAGPDNTDFSGWTQEMQDVFWNTYVKTCGIQFAQDIIDYCMANYADDYSDYYDAVFNNDVAFGMLMWGFGDFNDDDMFYSTTTEVEYDLEHGVVPTAEDYWNEIATEYDYDFSDNGINYEISPDSGLSISDSILSSYISGEGAKDPAAGGEIMNIAGIKKTGDYSMTVTTDYFDATTIYQFGFEISPLHYYGDVNQYNYNNNQFGFPKGDLSLARAVQTVPLGSGPYKFISYENGVVSYEANENYWKGEPKIKYLRFQECTDADKLAGVVAGTFDITDPSFSDETVSSIKGYNSNGDLTGDTVATSTVDFLGYGYIGIAANNVKVGDDPGSQQSKDLRAGLATVIAVYRNTVINSYYGDRASVIQYPISNTSWAAPRPNDEGYRVAYSRDVDGNDIYTDSMTEDQRAAAALDAAIGFFKAAGYTWDDAAGKFTAAPNGAQMAYEIIIPADGVGDHPAYGILTAAKEALAKIGITLEINDPTDSNVLWRTIESGQGELWCAAWLATIDPDMYQVYHSSNIVGAGGTDSNTYSITDDELDQLIMEARTSADQAFRKATYRRCLEIIMDWAVEIPDYQRQNAIIFSPVRVNMATVTPDISTFYEWWREIENIEMNT